MKIGPGGVLSCVVHGRRVHFRDQRPTDALKIVIFESVYLLQQYGMETVASPLTEVGVATDCEEERENESVNKHDPFIFSVLLGE